MTFHFTLVIILKVKIKSISFSKWTHFSIFCTFDKQPGGLKWYECICFTRKDNMLTRYTELGTSYPPNLFEKTRSQDIQH